MMQEGVSLPETVWQKLGLSWAFFFGIQGLINLYVAFTFSMSTWVTYKAFGAMGLMFAFILAQAFFLSKYIKETEETK